MFVVIVDIEKCVACGACVKVCPNQMFALTEEDGRQYVVRKGDPGDCIGCYSCEASCEEGAIQVMEL